MLAFSLLWSQSFLYIISYYDTSSRHIFNMLLCPKICPFFLYYGLSINITYIFITIHQAGIFLICFYAQKYARFMSLY
jgi:hypothetical protein